jgi:hypothetical protein
MWVANGVNQKFGYPTSWVYKVKVVEKAFRKLYWHLFSISRMNQTAAGFRESFLRQLSVMENIKPFGGIYNGL